MPISTRNPETHPTLFTLCCVALAAASFLPEANVNGRLNHTPQWQFAIHVSSTLRLDTPSMFGVYFGLTSVFTRR